ncbi:GntR family transcriptional regulator [Pigmentiphaga litoralis]|uniref:DNA-binding GntR family transcriptional regulator n=1 Tax=Pigmentiphaga litoralis TaxID=516702 RepID=A0A7Y9IRT1_9BURK|nr:GntR family transcriptional regulator [Pigmentiphaga litoralis]NYE24496.1 DNA-binding GntR family transcriptional regulator [Pigmentiphaga litoralis]NYE81890.1 DNA-binding GntR family transcriptional regulator [Pigmentiphaga litoralis]
MPKARPALPVSEIQDSSAAVPSLDPSRRADVAYERLRQSILSCRILPGATLTEAGIMDMFEAGKASVRIALVRLIQEGLVRSMPRHGYTVIPITLNDVEEIFALRLQLEPYAARLATGKVEGSHLQRLEDACRSNTASTDSGNRIGFFLDANREFHLAIAKASGNQRLHKSLTGLMDEMARLVALGFVARGDSPDIRHDHNALIDALVTGDAKRAEQIARRHIEVFRDMTLDRVMQRLRDAHADVPVPVPTRTRSAQP